MIVPVGLFSGNGICFKLKAVSYDDYIPKHIQHCVSVSKSTPNTKTSNRKSLLHFVAIMQTLLSHVITHYRIHERYPQFKFVTTTKEFSEETKNERQVRETAIDYFEEFVDVDMLTHIAFLGEQLGKKAEADNTETTERLKSLLKVANGLYDYLGSNPSLINDWKVKSQYSQKEKSILNVVHEFNELMDDIHYCNGSISSAIVDMLVSGCAKNKGCDLADFAEVFDTFGTEH
jgi:hypothetical protein